jgi:hypothetical protein
MILFDACNQTDGSELMAIGVENDEDQKTKEYVRDSKNA